jgi:hypothetical protein
MEDATISETKGFSNGEAFFGVYDGHGGNASYSPFRTFLIFAYRLISFQVHRRHTGGYFEGPALVQKARLQDSISRRVQED